jgi:hypothetical protein
MPMNALDRDVMQCPAVQNVLTFLAVVRQIALDHGHDVADYAVSLDTFERFGLFPNLASVLQQESWIERACPIEKDGRLLRAGNCVWLTEAGTQRWERERRQGPRRKTRAGDARGLLIPVWCLKTRELWLGGRRARRFKERSPKVQALLDAYRISGCALKVASPFTGADRIGSLKGAIVSANADQDPPRAVFAANPGYSSFRWEVEC